MTVRSIFCCVPAGAPSGGRSCFGGGPFLPPGAPRRVEGILMDPATSTKTTCIQLFLFYSTAGTVMQVFFYKTVTFWGCVDEVTEFRCCFWLFCTMEMCRRASAASPQGDQLAGRGRAAPHAPYGARRPPQGGAVPAPQGRAAGPEGRPAGRRNRGPAKILMSDATKPAAGDTIMVKAGWEYRKRKVPL